MRILRFLHWVSIVYLQRSEELIVGAKASRTMSASENRRRLVLEVTRDHRDVVGPTRKRAPLHWVVRLKLYRVRPLPFKATVVAFAARAVHDARRGVLYSDAVALLKGLLVLSLEARVHALVYHLERALQKVVGVLCLGLV